MQVKQAHQKGLVGEQRVALRATQQGYIVSRPIGEARYDLLLDDASEIHRVQVKYVSHVPSDRQGVFEVPLTAQCRNNGYERGYGRAEIDALVVYLAPIDTFCWLPAELVETQRTISLRHEPASNGQTARVNFVDDFRW